MTSQNSVQLNGSFNHLIKTLPKIFLLKNILTPLLEEGLVIAFSGGGDSSFLLWAAVETLKFMGTHDKQGRLLALLAVSPSIPAWEVQEAKKFAEWAHVDFLIVDSQELKQEAYAKNDGMRCYYCKSELFNIAKREAQRNGYHHIAYGYNASDRHDVRFGHLAAEENKIYAPLDQAGLEKTEIRTVLRQIGLNIADKPASPCLASRIMTGVRVTEDKLQHIEKMENILRKAGLSVYRVRVHEEKMGSEELTSIHRYFRIEVTPEEMLLVLDIRKELVHQAHQLGYRWVNLDLSGYALGGGTLRP